MKLITRSQAARLSEGELRGLYRTIFNALVQSQAGSAERRNGLASLENLTAELAAREFRP